MSNLKNNIKSINGSRGKTAPRGSLGTVTYKIVPISDHEWQEKCRQMRKENKKFFDRIDVDFKRMFDEARAKRTSVK